MNVGELVGAYWRQGILWIILFSGIIQVSPIKINPWTWVARKIGNALNKDVIEKVDKIEKTLDRHIETNLEENAINCRVRILRFADDVQSGVNHSQSHFEQILQDITDYNNYCDEHPHFKNHVTVHSAKLIEDAYDEKLHNNSFL